jgi:NADH-quinone oxidoreductase subunit N
VQLGIPSIGSDFFLSALPVIILCLASILAMLQSVFPRIGGQRAVAGSLAAGLLGALILTWRTREPQTFLAGALVIDAFSVFGQTLILLIASALGFLAWDTAVKKDFFRGETVSLYLMVIAGMMVMVSSLDIVTLFVGIELASIGIYCLVGYVSPSMKSQEGAVKYFILGSLAAAFLLMGAGLLYAGTGTLQVNEIVSAIRTGTGSNPLVALGAFFAAISIAVKLALVPFHLWAPDAYESAPTMITALMATAVKVMILVFTLRFFAGGMAIAELSAIWMPILTFAAGLSMIAGNIMAMIQTSFKRMLAYSSIAHSGYLAVALCSLSGTGVGQDAIEAVLFYLVGYSVISVGAFGIIMWLEGEKSLSLQLEDLIGLGKRHPWIAAALTICMLGFAGMPPTVGFLGKFLVFKAALSAKLYPIVIVGALGSAISFYYYLNVIVKMYLLQPRKGSSELVVSPRPLMTMVLVFCSVVLILLAGLLPGTLLEVLKI